MDILASNLLAPRKEFGFQRMEALVLALYAASASWLAALHQPWFDEVQAWLIARESGLLELFARRLHYEGTPGLWHLILWALSHLFYMPLAGLHVASLAAGVAAVYLWLRFAPFGRLLRVVLPFTFPMLFQTVVIARSYSLVPLLVFLLCVALRPGHSRPWLVALLAVLLANTSLIAFALGVGLVAFALVDRRTGLLRASHRLLPATILVAGLLFALYTATPAPDITFGPGADLAAKPAAARILSRVTAIPMPTGQPAAVNRQTQLVLPPPPPPPAYLRWIVRLKHHSIASKLVHGIINALSLAFFPVSSSNLLAAALFVTLAVWLYRNSLLACAIPFVATLIAGLALHIGERHTSVVFIALLAGVWLAGDRLSNSAMRHPSGAVLNFLLAAILLEQIGWSASATMLAAHQPFDGSAAAARFLLPQSPSARIALVDGTPSTINGYAAGSLFYNQTTGYYPWRVDAELLTTPELVLSQHPDWIADGDVSVGDTSIANQIMPTLPHNALLTDPSRANFLTTHGYRKTKQFCGVQSAHFGTSLTICDVLYQPEGKAR